MENGILEMILDLEIVFKPSFESKRIFGETFVKNNKDNFKIIYENKEYNMMEYFEVDKTIKTLKIKLKQNKYRRITDISHMFEDCSSLISLPYISFWDTHSFTKINCMFKGCSSLKALSDISKWRMENS